MMLDKPFRVTVAQFRDLVHSFLELSQLQHRVKLAGVPQILVSLISLRELRAFPIRRQIIRGAVVH